MEAKALAVLHKPLAEIEKMSRAELRAYIQDIEDTIVEHGIPVEVPVWHHFSKGVYAREMRMPQGAMVVGKIHKHENLCIISEGEASVLSQDGVQQVKAPFTFVASPGAKRVILAHTPLTWTVVHGTNEKCLDKIEAEFIAKTYDEVASLDGGDKAKELPCPG